MAMVETEATKARALARAIEGAAALDPAAKAVAKAVRGALDPGPVKDALSGTWLGHALHPLLTDAVIGTWLSALVLDVTGSDADATERLIAAGVVCAVPTAVTGATDWADAEPAGDGVRRVGAVHAAGNLGALGLQIASLAARRRGALARRGWVARRDGLPRRSPELQPRCGRRSDGVRRRPGGLDRRSARRRGGQRADRDRRRRDAGSARSRRRLGHGRSRPLLAPRLLSEQRRVGRRHDPVRVPRQPLQPARRPCRAWARERPAAGLRCARARGTHRAPAPTGPIGWRQAAVSRCGSFQPGRGKWQV